MGTRRSAQQQSNIAWRLFTLPLEETSLVSVAKSAMLPTINHHGPQNLSNLRQTCSTAQFTRGAVIDVLQVPTTFRGRRFVVQEAANALWALVKSSIPRAPVTRCFTAEWFRWTSEFDCVGSSNVAW